MPNAFRFLLDKSIKFHAQHKELSCLMNTPAINRLGQLSELKSSSSRLAADSPGNFPSFSSVSNIDHSNQVSPSPSGLELDRPNLLCPPSVQEIGFRNQTPFVAPSTSWQSLSDLVTPVNPPTASGVSGKVATTALKKILNTLSETLGMLNILIIVDEHSQQAKMIAREYPHRDWKVLISIVKDYEDRHLGHLLAPSIRDLSEAIQACLYDINRQIDKGRFLGMVEVDEESRFIVGTFGKISLLLDVFGHYLHRAYSEKFGYLPQRRWIPCSPWM
ncbi:hypothetical protein JB92DRAFT_3149491 [Gautieria morchelliformis]|nr:hypothetical protein JB92DRAFT_3149491 [Gautieria morchelliformis]